MKHRTGYLFKRGSNFYCSWRVNGKPITRALRDDGGQPISTKREAEIARTKLLAPIMMADKVAVLESIEGRIKGQKAEQSKWEDEHHPPSSIGQAWSVFLESSAIRPDSGEATLRQYEYQWQAFADWMKEKHAEVLALRDVTKKKAEEYANSLRHIKFSPSTYNKHLNLLMLVFRVLKDRAKLTSNPWESPKRGGFLVRKVVVPQSRRELTIEELRKVCQAATGELQTLLAIGIYTGLRLGDCATLRYAEIDFGSNMICRIPNKTARHKDTPVNVPVHAVLREMILATPPNQRGDYVLPDFSKKYKHRAELITDIVQKHFKKCGLKLYKPDTGVGGKRAVVEVGFHSLRHSFVSLCRKGDAPMAVVQSIVGHSNPAMTRHYTHVGPQAQTKTVALLPDISTDAEPAAPVKHPSVEIIREARLMVESLTSKNLNKVRSRLLDILDTD